MRAFGRVRYAVVPLASSFASASAFFFRQYSFIAAIWRRRPGDGGPDLAFFLPVFGAGAGFFARGFPADLGTGSVGCLPRVCAAPVTSDSTRSIAVLSAALPTSSPSVPLNIDRRSRIAARKAAVGLLPFAIAYVVGAAAPYQIASSADKPAPGRRVEAAPHSTSPAPTS